MRILLAVLTSLWCLTICLLLIRIRMRAHDDIVDRMEFFSQSSVEQRQQRLRALQRGKTLRERLRNWVHRTAEKLQRFERTRKLDLKMQQAGWPLLGTEFELMQLGFSMLLGLLTLAVTLDITAALLAFIAGIAAGMILLRLRIQRRQKLFTNQLGDMLTMVANALRAGFSFLQAFELIAKEMPAPMSTEAQQVINEINLGGTLENALNNMQKRVESDDFELVITSVLIQRQVGGNLAQILDTISETIEERIRMRREVLSLTAQGRLSGMILAALPPVLAVLISVISPGYMAPLLENEVGKYIIAGCVVMELIGFIIIRRIVDIK